ncbi:MAG: CidA/LrgA family protein [Burkholderiaceae bacterium]
MQSITQILVCQLVGEGMSRGLGLPVPGPVLGMVLMFSWLLMRGSVSPGLSAVAGLLLGNLSLLFVPAGVGVVMHLGLLGRDWLPISLALVPEHAAGDRRHRLADEPARTGRRRRCPGRPGDGQDEP